VYLAGRWETGETIRVCSSTELLFGVGLTS